MPCKITPRTSQIFGFQDVFDVEAFHFGKEENSQSIGLISVNRNKEGEIEGYHVKLDFESHRVYEIFITYDDAKKRTEQFVHNCGFNRKITSR